MMKDFSSLEVWFVTGSQFLYGEETLRTVASHSQEMVNELGKSPHIPVKLIFKPVLKTPDEIYERVHAKVPAVNRATVYRTLEFLLELGLVTTGRIKGNRVIYELVSSSPHHHLVCQRCDRVEQVDHELVAPLFAGIEQASGFKINTDHLMLFGLCAACRKVEADTLSE